MVMKELTFKVTTDEANLILEGLGHIPFARVFSLVAKLQSQAQEQMNGGGISGEEPEEEKPKPTIKK